LAQIHGVPGFAFGSFRFLEYGLYDSPARDVLLAFLATSELLHYYYGGFFWKIRDTDTSYGLGLSNARCAGMWAIGLTPVVF
jgi:hypothetical protein